MTIIQYVLNLEGPVCKSVIIYTVKGFTYCAFLKISIFSTSFS